AGAFGAGGGVGPGGFILIAAVLFTAMALVAFCVGRRGPRAEVAPESAWTGLGRLAARFGFGPRPTQTAYEYATALGEILPGIRPELQTVATAKVEVAYGGAGVGARRCRGESCRSPTPAGSSATTGSRRSGLRTRSCASGCCGCCSGEATGSASSADPRLRLKRPRAAPFVGLGAGPLVEDRREVGDQVYRPDQRPAAADLDHDDPGEVERPHPEPLERQVEQRQQKDLEDAVVADDHRPRASVGLRSGRGSVARDLRSVERPRRPRGSEARQDPAERRPEPRLDVRQRPAARGPRWERRSPPCREEIAAVALDLRAVESLPLALADLEEAGIGANGDNCAERRRAGHRRRDRP